MTKENRTELYVVKHIRGLSNDKFTVIVSSNKSVEVAKAYVARGYTVINMSNL